MTRGPRSASGSAPSTHEVGEPNWPFRLRVPAGWKVRHEAGGALLGHDSVPGIILVLPHALPSLQALRQEMTKGVSAADGQLTLAGALQNLEHSAVAADYQGFWQGSYARARGVGTCSPHGGGAVILAISTPDAYTPQLVQAAEALGTGIRFVASHPGEGGPSAPGAPADAAGTQFLIGTWVTTTTSTQTSFTLLPDGTFTSAYEASYSASPGSDGTTDWGLARRDSNTGHWAARGTPEQGMLALQFRDGRQVSLTYQVHVERGKTYWGEYYFDGVLYARQ